MFVSLGIAAVKHRRLVWRLIELWVSFWPACTSFTRRLLLWCVVLPCGSCSWPESVTHKSVPVYRIQHNKNAPPSSTLLLCLKQHITHCSLNWRVRSTTQGMNIDRPANWRHTLFHLHTNTHQSLSFRTAHSVHIMGIVQVLLNYIISCVHSVTQVIRSVQ